MAKKNKEQYVLQMEAYKQKKDEEAGHFMKEEEDHMKLQKQQALQLLKKKEKTENIIKVFYFTSFRFQHLTIWMYAKQTKKRDKEIKSQNKTATSDF